MKASLIELCGSNIQPSLEMVLYTECNIIQIIRTLIAFDLIYSKFSELCPTSCLGIASTPAFTKIPPLPGYQKVSKNVLTP